MQLNTKRLGAIGAAVVLAGGVVWAQTRGGGSEWLTAGQDAQRSHWIRSDAAISVESMSGEGFALQWKSTLDNQPRGMENLSQGVTANGVTLFVPLSLVAGSSNNFYALDSDTGFAVWQRHFDLTLPAPTAECPGGIPAASTRIVDLEPAPNVAVDAGGGGGGRAGYRSTVGEPGEGVPTNAPRRGGAPARGNGAAARAGGAGAAGRAAAAAPARGGGGGGRGNAQAGPPDIPGAPGTGGRGGFGRPAGVTYVITSDGILHVLGLVEGKEMQPPARFLPANAYWSDPVAVGTTLYTSTSRGCGGAPSGVWAIDLDDPAKPVTSWKTNGGDVVGSVSLTPDGTLLAAIGPGEAGNGGYANAIVALDSKTLTVKDWFTSPTTEFVSTPLVFVHDGKTVVAAATRDGRIVLLDAASLGGANHATPLFTSNPLTQAGAAAAPTALTMWQERPADGQPAGTQPATWLLAPVAGPPAGGAQGAITHGAVMAMKVVSQNGRLSLQPGWTSRDLVSPIAPIVVNGVAFVASTGRPAAAGASGSPAVIYALDASTGKELWNSGTTITSYLPGRSFWSANGQVYAGANDGTVYAFGFPMERY